ncbi:tail fiber domain-containing protein [Portibacter lacus]|uniref:Peptidase S74 domain-containing protein n=1 Tax=Portibacter lacus TaxID=1099794 RepID=A0AA37SRB1_9BACT|nr:tail fiber domain-containing protein [Portibacter lacus]GLR18722.1 hypothetical protein GCM10007940_33380 [Portibacter lacus]
MRFLICLLLLTIPIISLSQNIILGRDAAPINGENVTENFSLFNKTKGAFAGGQLANSPNWSPDSLGLFSLAWGYNVKSKGEGSFAVGNRTTASGIYSVSMGYQSLAEGDLSFAFGDQSYAKGTYAVALGSRAIASGNESFALGFVEANGQSSFATGILNEANGNATFVIGQNNYANGNYSFAAGSNSETLGDHSTAIGSGVRAYSYNEFVIGLNNTSYTPNSSTGWVSSDRLFVIGNGINSPSDAMVVLKNGNTTINGETTLNGNSRITDSANPELLFERTSPGSYDAKIRVGSTGHMYFEGGADISSGLSPIMTLRSNGRLGIRDSSPDKEFHVKGQAKIEAYNTSSDANLYMQSGSGLEGRVITYQRNTEDIYLGDVDDVGNDVFLRAGGSERISILNNGNVGIGNSNPSQKLHVQGNICYTGSIGACSDRRYKLDFKPISSALSKVNQLNGYYYYWNQDAFPQKNFNDDRQIGVIAQEIEAIFPEMVMTDDDGYKSVDYSRLTPVLVEAVKELSDRNNALEKELSEIKEQIKYLKDAQVKD